MFIRNNPRNDKVCFQFIVRFRAVIEEVSKATKSIPFAHCGANVSPCLTYQNAFKHIPQRVTCFELNASDIDESGEMRPVTNASS